MRIAFFAHGNPTNQDGATMSMLNIIDELVRRGHDCVLVASSDANLGAYRNHPHVKLLVVPSYNTRTGLNPGLKTKGKTFVKCLINRRVRAGQVTDLLSRENIDIIHINGLNNGIGAMAARRLSIPYVWHIRQFLDDDFSLKLYNEKEVYGLVEGADAIIAITKAVRDKFEPVFKKPIRVIYNGVPLGNYVIPDHVILRNECVNLLFPGRIAEGKGQIDAVRAVKILKDRDLPVKLTFVGGSRGDYCDQIKAFAAGNGLEPQVAFVDHVFDLRPLRADADIGLTCSKKEAFGRVIVENQMAGMLTIGSDTGGIPEIIDDGETGLLYRQGDAQSLADKIAWAAENREEARRIAAHGSAHASDYYSIERVVDEVLDVYAEVLNRD